MTAGWVAAATRSRTLVGHLAGPAQARLVADADWDRARHHLAGTVYGRELPPAADRVEARRAAMATALWQLRVLAGWFPPGQGSLARLFAAPMELANIEAHLAALAGDRSELGLPLGSMAVAWPRVAAAASSEQVRSILATSVWGDPGTTDRSDIGLWLRLRWAHRLASRNGPVARWATAAAAVLVARERFAHRRDISDRNAGVADDLLRPRWRRAGSVADLRLGLPPQAAWPLIGIDDGGDLWRAEVEVARTIAREAAALVESGRNSRSSVVGAMALLLVDLRRIVAAIDLAGSGPEALEVFDAVA